MPHWRRHSLTPSHLFAAGVQLAVLSGHPEEVYGIKFLSIPGSTQQPQGATNSNNVSDMLVSASGESLFLWDLHTSQLLHESAPVPVAGLAKLSINATRQAASGNGNSSSSSSSGDRKNGSSQRGVKATANGSTQAAPAAAAAPAVAGSGQIDEKGPVGEGPDEEEEDEGEVGDEEAVGEMPSYIFSLANAEGTSWLAGCCADGLLRLWDAGQHSLQEVAAVKVQTGQQGWG